MILIKKVSAVALMAVLSVVSFSASAQLCDQNLIRLDLGDPMVQSFQLSYYQGQITWTTNRVCNANGYQWILQDGQTTTTSGRTLSMQVRDLVWLPAGGCDEFNSRMTFPNPHSDIGVYHTTLTVSPVSSSQSKTVPVSISDVAKCTEIGDDGFYGGGSGGIGGE